MSLHTEVYCMLHIYSIYIVYSIYIIYSIAEVQAPCRQVQEKYINSSTRPEEEAAMVTTSSGGQAFTWQMLRFSSKGDETSQKRLLWKQRNPAFDKVFAPVDVYRH